VKHKLTIIVAVMEAVVLLTMKLMDWKEAKTEKPAASKARTVKGRRVVKLSPQEYHGEPPTGENSAVNLLAGSSASDKNVHKEE